MKKNYNKKLLSSILAASAVVSSSGLAAVVGFLSEGSSFEACAAEGDTWFNVICSKLNADDIKKLASFSESYLGIQQGSGKDLLSNYDGLLTYVTDVGSILTDENMEHLRKYYHELAKLIEGYSYTEEELKTDTKMPLPKYIENLTDEKNVRTVTQNIVDKFNADGTLKPYISLDNNLVLNVLNNFTRQFNIGVLVVAEEYRVYLFDNKGVNDMKVDVTPVFKVLYETAAQVLNNLNNNQDNQGGSSEFVNDNEEDSGPKKEKTDEEDKDPNVEEKKAEESAAPTEGTYMDSELGAQDEEMTSAGRLDPQEEAVSDEEVSAQKIGEEEVASEEKGSERSVDGGVRATKPVPDTGLESVMMLATLLAAISVVAAAKRSRD